MPLTGPPEGKSLEIDTVSQNRSKAIKNHEICEFFKKNSSRILVVTPGGRGYPLRQRFMSW